VIEQFGLLSSLADDFGRAGAVNRSDTKPVILYSLRFPRSSRRFSLFFVCEGGISLAAKSSSDLKKAAVL
jgi:hypothetical protein